MARLPALTCAAALAAILGGCTVDALTYTTGTYGTTSVRHVHLGCADTYEVYDRPQAGTLLVVTNGANEGLAEMCGGPVAGLPRAERMRRTARLFLDESTGRPQCRITAERPIADWHTEYTYACGGPAAPARPRRPS